MAIRMISTATGGKNLLIWMLASIAIAELTASMDARHSSSSSGRFASVRKLLSSVSEMHAKRSQMGANLLSVVVFTFFRPSFR